MKRKIIPILSDIRYPISDIRNRVFLAPMEEVNDPAFRMLCKKAGAALTWTPLTSPLSPLPLILDDKPILQLFGGSELLKSDVRLQMSDFMKLYDSKVSGWDFNLGCPATTAKNHCYGSYLESPETVEKIISFMREHTEKPLLMKIRKSKYSYDYLKIAEKYCDAISIHPRTKEQAYSGDPDIEWAKGFKKDAKIPVIYSGNIDEKNHEEFLKTFDYVMIGRNAIGHPEIFAKISGNKRFKRDFKDYLVIAEKYDVPWRIIKFQAMQFTKGDYGSREKRASMIKVKNLEELKKIFFE